MEINIAYREHRGGEDVAVVEGPDGSRTVLRAWMLDVGTCAAMTIGPARAAIFALVELRSALEALAFDRSGSPVGEQKRSDESPTASTKPTRVTAPAPRPRAYRSRPERAAGDPSRARRAAARSPPNKISERRIAMKRGELPASVLDRRAIVYVRQSTLIQVEENVESQRPARSKASSS